METNNYGYHTKEIKKGTLGDFSKIREEFEELEDAYKQNDKIMMLCELSDLIGAIKHFTNTISACSVSLNDLIAFNEKTERAFKNGQRK